MRIFIIAIISIFSFQSFAQTTNWTQQLSSAGADYIGNIKTDAAGNIYTCGWFEKTINIGSNSLTSAGAYDMFIAKYNSSGNCLWAIQAGGSAEDVAKSISVDTAGYIYVTGYFEDNASFENNSIASDGARDIFISKYDTAGNLIWVEHVGGIHIDEANAITTDAVGNVYVAGVFNSSASFDTTSVTSVGLDDIFVTSYTSEGTFRWVQQAGGSENDNITGIACDNNSNIYLSGYFNDTLLINNDTVLSTGLTDALILKYDSSGNIVWHKNYGGTNYDYTSGIATTSNGYFYLTGNYTDYILTFESDTLWNRGESDFFISLFDTAGTYQWSSRGGGADYDYTFDINVDKDDNAYITGAIKDSLVTFYDGTQMQSAGGDDAFIAKYTENGDLFWAQQFGSTYYEYGNAIATDTSGNIYLGGTFENSLALGTDTLTCQGLTDVYITSYTNITSGIINTTINAPTIIAFPNPTEGAFTLEIKGKEKTSQLIITNALGQVIEIEKVSDGKDYLQLNLSNQPSGMYLLNVVSNNSYSTFKIVKR